MKRMDFRILGPIRVLDHGHETYLSARKVQALLAVLLIMTDRVVSVDQLIAEIWAGDPPRRANASLHVYVSQVRKFLARPGSDPRRVTTRGPGYLLTLGDEPQVVFDFLR